MNRLTGLAAAMVLVAGACTSAATPAPTPAAPTPTAGASAAPSATAKPSVKDLGTLKLALGTAPLDPTLAYFYFSTDEGFYLQNGLQVLIEQYNGDPTANRALIAGQDDVVLTGCGSALQAIDQGASLKIISAFAPKVNYQLVGMSDITRPKGFEGRNVGVSGPGAVSYTVPLLLIKGDGGDTSKVNVVSVGGTSARLQALIAKKIDGTVINANLVPQIASYNYLHVIADAFKAIPNYLYTCEVTTQAYFTSHHDALQAFVNGTAQGLNWFYNGDNIDTAAHIVQRQLTSTSLTDLTNVLVLYKTTHFWNEKGTLEQAAFDFTVQAAKDAGDIKGNLSYSTVVDTQLTQNLPKQ